jgi:YidC/Oxa1 family membrane protein insertase
MERRVLLAIFLCFLVLYLWNTLVVRPAPQPTPGRRGAPAAPSPAPAGEPAATASEPGALPAPSEVVATPLVGDSMEREVRIETRDVIAVFTNRGARLKSWRLKHFLDQKNEPLDLVAKVPSRPLPFSLRTADAPTTAALNGSLYTVQEERTGSPDSTPTRLVFEYRDTAGLRVKKEFELAPSSYTMHFRVAAHRERDQARDENGALPLGIEWGPALGDGGAEASQYVARPRGLLIADGEAQRLDPSDFATQAAYSGSFALAGVDDHYFLAAALFPSTVKITYQAISIPPPVGSEDEARQLVSFVLEPAGAEKPFRFFVGPKDFDVLESIDPGLTQAIDFGWFRVIVVPLLQSLKWINGFIGNYGWSIIILTVIINAIMLPLRHKQVVSMRKMQELQPEIKAIQDRYSKLKATDPARQKMNQELMALYKERGANPASGCLPMVLTMPVLIAFYALLQTAIELRGAPFVAWIHDLSRHDPLYVTPILMGVTMVWQQKITPAAGADPIQQKMMMIMPIVFTAMFLWFPAGVTLYYLMSNLWGIGQQYLTNYLIGPPHVRSPRPPAERRVKRPGSV